MAKTNNQAQGLLKQIKAINRKAKNYLADMDKKIAELDMKYAKHLVENDISIMKAAKNILQNKK